MPFHKAVRLAALCLFISGCAVLAGMDLTSRFGSPQVQDRQVAHNAEWGKTYNNDVKPIIEQRCSVCHGCYDAPCQLKLTSLEGIDRGASKDLVYDGARLLEAEPLRLNIDAKSTQAWRDKGFFPVLNERQQSPVANRQAGLMYRLLEQKRQHPLPTEALLPDSFTLGTYREHQCPKAEELDLFQARFPLWGMPYALPALNDREHSTLTAWLDAGAPMPEATPLPAQYTAQVKQWEAFFNQPSLKAQLVNRYIYEHLFLAHLYFEDLHSSDNIFFKLVRSYTPPGEPIDIVPTRRPYDDPGADTIYYRLQWDQSSLLAKTHMPYPLSAKRKQQWQQWFYEEEYSVNHLPNYTPEVASNPFKAFEQLPVASRYRFMLEEAEFTIMGFIKGPVCRGQVALNVIRDRFWVFFEDPDTINPAESAAFLAQQSKHLRLPAEAESTLRPISRWTQYSNRQRDYLKAKYEVGNQVLGENGRLKLTTDLIWDGEGKNPNAALTVFRHFDSATVVKGLVGDTPQTAWVIGYPILERIHYLLVAGFDVYGNVGHQLLTRLYMDFLRMEAEFNFLILLPHEEQEKIWAEWYEGTSGIVHNYVKESSKLFFQPTAMNYSTDNPRQELFDILVEKLNPVLDHRYTLANNTIPELQRRWLKQIGYLKAPTATLLPQVTFLSVEDKQGQLHLYTVLRNNAHSNIDSLLREDANRRPERDDITVVKGLIGTYPGAFWHVKDSQLEAMASALATLNSEEDYRAFMDSYGVRRTAADFWQHSDKLHNTFKKASPINYGLLDFNRLENR
ncbi:fatty acid cis/trans isomerase [Maricurvus nonylphenolicus]|uniref:fatty acid cis/trans isomerase n=1 Tax=Maricurvus nonylphenolicus TaxID=1008307 RepID=UPI0036F26DDA